MSEASETGAILVDSAARMLGDVVTRERIAAAEQGAWPTAIWNAAVEMGLDRAAQSEERGGAGGIDARDLCALQRLCGRLSVPLPLAETWMAERALAAAGLPPPDESAVSPALVRTSPRTFWLNDNATSGALSPFPVSPDMVSEFTTSPMSPRPLRAMRG